MFRIKKTCLGKGRVRASKSGSCLLGKRQQLRRGKNSFGKGQITQIKRNPLRKSPLPSAENQFRGRSQSPINERPGDWEERRFLSSSQGLFAIEGGCACVGSGGERGKVRWNLNMQGKKKVCIHLKRRGKPSMSLPAWRDPRLLRGDKESVHRSTLKGEGEARVEGRRSPPIPFSLLTKKSRVSSVLRFLEGTKEL